ncbi:helix-turn-helix domain-containing protein [Burkholderia multivorans]|uniref:transcriptional regulator n=1 Tax=Burkholderia TaxID=32008 RepID=UPI001AA0AA7D|nr:MULTISPECIES: YdaS family helix-turn-helix protein [Burkholderia]MBR8021213.1 helix-turn-helix domain-containing protein [Burkholderia multivorans]MBU9391805.1 helix-turn-helix domain-containing protein [Burkholderia multivorans]MBU9489965.1 helix-turn-helix domain-containing protein [Burkholderia multivorans]QTD88333.1 helix-turn-helix domain-containing protein [Burkholderia anthina]HEF4732707.1 helix-turn-helix domain-containing protein [Burkholderia multivorans]
MDLPTFLSNGKHRQRWLADALGVTQGLISQWVRKKAVPPPGRCVAIERLTGRKVTRQELRDDWMDIWPELVQAPAGTPDRKDGQVHSKDGRDGSKR